LLTSSRQRKDTTTTGTVTDKVHYFTTFAESMLQKSILPSCTKLILMIQDNYLYTGTCFSCLKNPNPAPTPQKHIKIITNSTAIDTKHMKTKEYLK
jgi:hypothetical protein